MEDRILKTKEQLEEEWQDYLKKGPPWEFPFYNIGNSNIYNFDLWLEWRLRYQNAMFCQYYRDLGDGWFILITINKFEGIVAAFKTFDKDFDINSDADTKGDILHLYTGKPESMHEVEEIIKYNCSRNMDFVWSDSAPSFLKHPKTQEMGIISIDHPAPSILDFVEHSRQIEMHVSNSFGIPIKDHNHIIGPLLDHKTDVSIEDSDWLVSSLLMQTGFKGFGQRRKLAKKRNSIRSFSFYKKYKMTSGWDIRMI